MFPSEGNTYPAWVARTSPPGAEIRPLFSRLTVNRIMHDIAADEEAAVKSGDIPETDRFQARWSGRDLFVEAGMWVPPPIVYRPDGRGLYAFLPRSSWAEVWPVWPKNPPTAKRVISLLRTPTVDGRPLVFFLKTRVPTATLMSALDSLNTDSSNSADLLRTILATAVAMHEPPEPEAIARLLVSPYAPVRGEAAHGASHSSDTAIRSLLSDALRRETDDKVREVIEMAIGDEGSTSA